MNYECVPLPVGEGRFSETGICSHLLKARACVPADQLYEACEKCGLGISGPIDQAFPDKLSMA